MGVNWTDDERATVQRGIAEHGINSGRCAALARIVYAVAKPRDPEARGVHLRPAPGAVWLVPKPPHVPYWASHTYVETEAHAVDAITGADGYPVERFLSDHWEYSWTMRVSQIDPATIDPVIQRMDDEP